MCCILHTVSTQRLEFLQKEIVAHTENVPSSHSLFLLFQGISDPLWWAGFDVELAPPRPPELMAAVTLDPYP